MYSVPCEALWDGYEMADRTGDTKQYFSFLSNYWSTNQRNSLNTSWELEQEKTFIKWTLNGKDEDVHGKQFFGSVIFESL